MTRTESYTTLYFIIKCFVIKYKVVYDCIIYILACIPHNGDDSLENSARASQVRISLMK